MGKLMTVTCKYQMAYALINTQLKQNIVTVPHATPTNYKSCHKTKRKIFLYFSLCPKIAKVLGNSFSMQYKNVTDVLQATNEEFSEGQ